jgi:hypothetical protein
MAEEKNCSMDLELFPNEILLELFEYFNSADLFRVFYGLNSRFNSLLHNQFRAHRFQFKSIAKRHFDMICQQHLPFIADRIVGISLADNDDTPEQINLFFVYISSWNQFTCLRTLSLSNIPSFEILRKLLNECHHLSNLTHLRFSDPYFRIAHPDLQLVINSIWSLSKLIRCDLDISTTSTLFCMPKKISTSLEYVCIKGTRFKWKHVNRLFKCTPHLAHLSASIAISDRDNYKPSLHRTLVELKIVLFFTSTFPKMVSFLKNTPNLRRLDVHFRTGLVDGHRWEQVIRNYLPHLKILRFRMSCVYNEQNLQKQVVHLVDSYRGSFWIDEHQWFVRCLTWDKTISLYTLSHRFCHFGDNYNYPDSWRSTYPQDSQQNFCDNITDISSRTFFQQPIPSSLRMRNIEHLNLNLPITHEFRSIVSSLNRLHSLTILVSHIDTRQSQLQALLDRAPNLYRLTIHHDEPLPIQMSLFKCTNASIRQLCLNYRNYFFDEKQCKTLAHSPLGIQCEVLSIGVTSCESIVYFVKNMINLRSLDVECHEEMSWERFLRTENVEESQDESMSKKNTLVQWFKDRFQRVYCNRLPSIENGEGPAIEDDSMSNTDKLIQWLQDRLSPTYIIMRHPKFTQSILIWI